MRVWKDERRIWIKSYCALKVNLPIRKGECFASAKSSVKRAGRWIKPWKRRNLKKTARSNDKNVSRPWGWTKLWEFIASRQKLVF